MTVQHTWGRRTGLAGTAALVALALAACGDKDGGEGVAGDDAGAAATSASATATTSESTTTSPSTPADDDVKVLDAGSGDRQQLLLHLTEGERSTTTLQMTVATETDAVDVPPIPMTMTMSTEVTDVTAEKSTVHATYDGIELASGLPQELVAGLQPGLDAMKGMEMTFDYSPSGALLDADVSLPDGAPASVQGMVDQLSDSVTSMSIAFPSEPLGEGARWQGESTVDLAGMQVRQTATYELVSFDGESYTVAIATRGALNPPQGTAAMISKAKLTTEGEMTGDLGHVVPSSATTHGSTAMVVEDHGRKLRVTTVIDMSMTTEVQ